jgi:hypothetical protein
MSTTPQKIDIHFPDSGALDDFMRSQELTAQELRRTLATWLAHGIVVTAVTAGTPPARWQVSPRGPSQTDVACGSQIP